VIEHRQRAEATTIREFVSHEVHAPDVIARRGGAVVVRDAPPSCRRHSERDRTMKKRFTEAQIVGFLREADAGVAVKDLCRKHGFSEAS
jgi:hypothetical protein